MWGRVKFFTVTISLQTFTHAPALAISSRLTSPRHPPPLAAVSFEEADGEFCLLARKCLVRHHDAHHLALVGLLQLAADEELVEDVVGLVEVEDDVELCERCVGVGLGARG